MNIIKSYEKSEIDVFKAIFLLDTERTNEQQKNQGVVYTPRYIADYIINYISPNSNETILEPSSGHGLFAFCLLEHFSNFKNPEELKNWFENKLFLYEIDQNKINETKQLIKIYFSNIGINNINTNNIICKNTLDSNFKDKFDIILGNPPYIRSNNLNTNELNFIKNHYESCQKGNIDIYYAFLEFALKNSKRSGFITPNTYLKNKSANNLRNLLKNSVDSIIDFEDKQIFKGASIYTSIIFISEDNKHTFKFKTDINSEWTTLSTERLNDNIWSFKYHINKTDKKISDLAEFISQTATCKDSFFTIKDPILLNNNCYQFIKNNKTCLIEKDICKKFYKITKMHENRIIFFPYNNEFNLIKEDIIKNKYPQTYKYLNDFKKELLSRNKGNISIFEGWYAYGRKQGINTGNYRYYLLIPNTFSNQIKPFLIDTQKDPKNNFLASAGYIMCSDCYNDITYLKEIIESDDFSEYLKHNSKILSGKTPYYNFSSNIVKNYFI